MANSKLLINDLKSGDTMILYRYRDGTLPHEDLSQDRIEEMIESGELQEVEKITMMSEKYKAPQDRHNEVLESSCCDRLSIVRKILGDERHNSIQKVYFNKNDKRIDMATTQKEEHAMRKIKAKAGLLTKQEEVDQFLATVEQSAGNMYHMNRTVLREADQECPIDFKDWSCPCVKKVIDEYRTKKFEHIDASCKANDLELPEQVRYHFKTVEDWDHLWADFWEEQDDKS